MNEVKTSNIPSLSIGKIVDTLSASYCAVIEKGLPLKTLPSVMLWGAASVATSVSVSAPSSDSAKVRRRDSTPASGG